MGATGVDVAWGLESAFCRLMNAMTLEDPFDFDVGIEAS